MPHIPFPSGTPTDSPVSSDQAGWLNRLLCLVFPAAAGIAPDDPRSRSWVRRIAQASDIPPAYLPFFRQHALLSLSPFPYSVVVPAFPARHGRPQNELLICLIDGCVHILEQIDGGLKDLSFSAHETVSTERGLVLLYSWVTIRGGQAGQPQWTTIRFNTISEELMLPFVEALRACPGAASSSDLAAERGRFDFLAPTHFKFMSYARRSLRPGDRVLRIVFQPEPESASRVLKHLAFWRPAMPAHLMVLTDNEVIQISEEATPRWSRRAPHGAVWTYVPRSHIRHATLSEENAITSLTLDLDDGSRLPLHADSIRADELRQVCNDLGV